MLLDHKNKDIDCECVCLSVSFLCMSRMCTCVWVCTFVYGLVHVSPVYLNKPAVPQRKVLPESIRQIKKERGNYFFFSSCSVATPAQCEMIAVIKQRLSEWQAVSHTQTHTHRDTHTNIHTQTHTHTHTHKHIHTYTLTEHKNTLIQIKLQTHTHTHKHKTKSSKRTS